MWAVDVERAAEDGTVRGEGERAVGPERDDGRRVRRGCAARDGAVAQGGRGAGGVVLAGQL